MGYKTNQNKVVSEIFDDEVIVVNLENGAYYSLRESAVGIWKRIEAGCNRQQTLDGLNDLEKQVSFLDYLLSERLLLPDDTLPNKSWVPSTVHGTPEYTKYDDMKDLLLLDPIHEVDPKGWPNKRTG